MKPPEKEKEGQATKHLASRSRERCKEDRPHMGAAGETPTALINVKQMYVPSGTYIPTWRQRKTIPIFAYFNIS
jgi:hypothetical protein